MPKSWKWQLGGSVLKKLFNDTLEAQKKPYNVKWKVQSHATYGPDISLFILVIVQFLKV